MNIRYASILTSLSFVLLAGGPVWASDDAPLPSASTEMTQEEYSAYRERIREQLDAAQQAEKKDEEVTKRRRSNNGYGQGYRARQERAGGGAGMGRTSGRGR
jgi:uncharacterized membrane protein